MPIPFPSAVLDNLPTAGAMRWSKSERVAARKAFDHALQQELQELIQQAKRMAAEVNQPSDLWELEHHLMQRRKEIDRKHDYRYSQLTLVLGKLLHEGRLREQELCGLGRDKVESIHSHAKFLAEIDAGT